MTICDLEGGTHKTKYLSVYHSCYNAQLSLLLKCSSSIIKDLLIYTQSESLIPNS